MIQIHRRVCLLVRPALNIFFNKYMYRKFLAQSSPSRMASRFPGKDRERQLTRAEWFAGDILVTNASIRACVQ